VSKLASLTTFVRELALRADRLVGNLRSRLPEAGDVVYGLRLSAGRVARRGADAIGLASVVGSARPLKVAVLSLAALAAGGLGLMVAYAATPDDGLATQVLVTNGETYTVATITGPGGGTTTVAVTKTKTGKTKFIPVRVTRTVDGPGETEEVFVEVAGESVVLTETDTNILAQIVKQIETQTQVVTQVQPVTQTQVVTDVVTHEVTVTEIVNHTETVVRVETVTETQTVTDTVTETVTSTVTETVPLPLP
jgi:hypothetical protein